MKNNIVKIIIFIVIIIIFVFGYKYFISGKNKNTNTTSQITASTSPSIVQDSTLENLKSTPSPTPKEAIETTYVPILMYHHVKNCDDSCDDIEKGLSVSPEDFEAQMKYLQDNGYEAINLSDLFYKSDKKQVVLTFDDGYTDNIDEALPILNKYGYKATLFIITEMVGTDRYMNWDQIKTLKSNNWDLGGHTLNHPNLVSISTDEAKNQIQLCKNDIEKNTGAKVTFFSYPAGKFDENVASLVKDAGYSGAVTTIYDNVNNISNIYELTRIRINGSDSIDGFISKVSY